VRTDAIQLRKVQVRTVRRDEEASQGQDRALLPLL